ncbi:MAG: ketol-acid reductoisomerase [Euryarchaeota archaeon]|nr:ketol-acid reductoisomerase [Euryarchaeota archaeon]
MAKIYYEQDADLEILKEKTIAVIGYGSQGSAQANNMKDSGLKVIIGLRPEGASAERAKQDGFEVFPISEAAAKADIIHVLIPDEVQADVYNSEIAQQLKPGKALGFSHGFNIRFKQIVPPNFVDIIMIAPKGPGLIVRKLYKEGFGVPALIAVEQDYTGKAKQIALGMAKAIGSTKVGVIETTFAEECETDLFGEQVDLCGGVTELIKASFETLVEAGYQHEIAYFETLHELKLIVDLIYSRGLYGMWSAVSNTAKYGGLTRGKKIVSKASRRSMKKILEYVKSGKFAEEWMKENKKGRPKLNALLEQEKGHLIEKVGKEIRKMAGIEK